MTSRLRLSSGLTFLFLAACTPATTPATRPTPSAASPTAAELRRDLFVFASDSFGGRETGTPYAQKAAEWIAARLTQLGLEPGGDSGYFYRVPMERTLVTAGPISVTTPSGATTLQQGRDISFLSSLGPGAPLPKNSADAELVFARYGLADSALARDDYAGLNLTGKVVVLVGTAPPGVSDDKKKELENPQSLFNRIGLPIGRQPAAIVLLLPDSVYRLAASQFSGSQIALQTGAKTTPGPKPRVLPMVAVARMDGESPFLPRGWPNDQQAQFAAGTKFTGSYNEQTSSFNGYNVVGIARGSDPALKNTYVAFGAHYDHIGIQHGVTGDSIANGADDDGSGSVTQLAMARAWLAGPRPKRSALFIWHVGEEKGLFGSDAFTNHPTVPIDSIVAQLNADMIGRNNPDTLYLVGPGAAPNGQSAVLGAVVDSVNAASAHPFVFDREWDTTTHPERIYYRSDHYNYARKGVPIVFFTTGLHPQYHKVSDEPTLIDYDKMAHVGDLILRTGIAVGNRTTRPKPTGVQ